MDANELKAILVRPEWTEVQIKKSARSFPQEAVSTIGAFTNSGGGYLILGVDEKQLPSISGINSENFDDVQNQCLGLLQGQQKFTCPIAYDPSSMVEVDGALVLAIYIQDAKRQNKPVKLFEGKKGPAVYLRKGSRDEVASDEEVARMLIDANNAGFTDHLLELDVETCFNDKTLRWYRKVYESKHNQKHHELSNVEFLDELGLIREVDGDLKPTRAALLMFGSNKQMSHLLGRNVVDALWYNRSLEGEEGEERWADRWPLDDDTPNLFEAWQQLLDRFTYWAELPFKMDESSLQRTNEPPDYLGFREAIVNLLCHQDFSDHNRVPKIEYYKDGSRYWNPGDSLVEDIIQLKGDSASRNPLIMQTFHRISLSDRAGSGLKKIYKNWQQLERTEPEIINDKTNKSFQLTLGKKQQVSVLQQQFLERLGVNVNQNQARVFVASFLQPMTVELLVTTLTMDAADIFPAIDYLTRQSMFITSPAGY
jgi:ATP-dependent DNA helicase RecG